MRKKIKCIYKNWTELNNKEQTEVKKRLAKGQRVENCRFQYHAGTGKLLRILDYGALSGIFSI